MSDMSPWFKNERWNGTTFICQEEAPPISEAIWSRNNYVLKSPTSVAFLYIPLFVLGFKTICLLLKPLRMPNYAQLLVGIALGIIIDLVGVRAYNIPMVQEPFIYIADMLASIGFYFYLFMLGVETNINNLRFVGKKTIVIGLVGCASSVAFGTGTLMLMSKDMRESINPVGKKILIFMISQNNPTTTCLNLNDLGINSSELGRLAASISIFLNLGGQVVTLITVNIIEPLSMPGLGGALRLLVFVYYFVIFVVCRPLLLYIIKLTPEGKSMKRFHFVAIIMLVLLIGLAGELLDQKLAIFYFALTIPEEPLSSTMSERLDTFVSGILFPLFIILRGLNCDYSLLKKIITKDVGPFGIGLVRILVMSFIGRFLGTIIPSLLGGLSFSISTALSLILCAKGVFELFVVSYQVRRMTLYPKEYPILILYILISNATLPLARFLYNSTRQHSSILRPSIIEIQENSTFQTLICLYKEENVSGILNLLKLCHPSRGGTNNVFALQLLQLTSRAAVPILAPLHEVSSMATFRSNIERCNRIVNPFLYLGRETNGKTRVQHYVAMAPYATMHNDICALAYEKSITLIILPFHVSWSIHGKIEDSSLSIRDVNKMVLDDAPCSVGILVDKRISSHQQIIDNEVYHIAMLFIGGSDDYEALAYCTLFAKHPKVRLMVIWFKSPLNKDNNLDNEVMKQFQKNNKDNEMISSREVISNNGAETIDVVVSFKDTVDLVMVGKHHESMSSPLFGLSDGWSEYAELGILGDILASPDFEFSLMVIQQEPQKDFDTE